MSEAVEGGNGRTSQDAIALFTFLKELTELRMKAVRSVDQYDHVLWFNDIPRENDCFCVAWRPPPPFDSWFEVDVFLRIAERGYRVVPQYEVAGYWIDLVVEGMKGRLAVECDGDEWHGLDRYEQDVSRQRMLERCGWCFWRIRGSAFAVDPDAAMESLWETLERREINPEGHGSDSMARSPASSEEEILETGADSENGPDTSNGTSNDAEPRSGAIPSSGGAEDQKAGQSFGRPYREWQAHPLPDPRNSNPTAVAAGLREIVDAEGPVLATRVYRLFVQAAGIKKVGKVIRTELDRILSSEISRGIFAASPESSPSGPSMLLVRPPESPPVVVRTLGNRSFDEIPPSELAEVMRRALSKTRYHDLESLFRAVLAHYGLTRLTRHVLNELSRVYNELLPANEKPQFAEPASDTSERELGSGPSPPRSPSMGQTYGIILLGESFSVASLGEALITVLGQLADMDAEFLPRLSLKHGRTRRHVARRPEDIYPGRPDLATRYSREIRLGWYVGDNYARRDVERILHDACEIAGLTYGEDLVMQWPGEVEQN